MHHRNQELSKSVRLILFKSVLLFQDFLEWPEVKTSNPSQVSRAIKKFLGPLTTQSRILGHSAEQLHHLRQVVIVFAILVAFTGLK